MDEATFNETVERLKKVSGIIADLDEAIRADAFEILVPYVIGGEADDAEADEGEANASAKRRKARSEKVDYDHLIEEYESDKDSENAKLSLAILFDRHGRGPFQMSHIKNIADEFNISVPVRLDMTFKGAAKQDGKEVLRKQSDGWKVTPAGETWLKTTYGVAKGKKPLPTTSS